MIDYEAAKFWLDLGQWALTLGIGLYVWQSNRHQVSQDRIDKIEEAMGTLTDGHNDRLSRIEEQLKHVPTHGDLGGVFKRVDEVHGDLRELIGRFSGLQGQVSTIHQRLMQEMER